MPANHARFPQKNGFGLTGKEKEGFSRGIPKQIAEKVYPEIDSIAARKKKP